MNDAIAHDFQGGMGESASTMRTSQSDAMLVLAGRDGCVRFCNSAALQHFGIQTGALEDRPSIWEWFAGTGAQLLRSQAAAQPAGASSWLHLLMHGGDGVLHCQLEWFAQDFVLLAQGVEVKPGRVARSRGGAERRGDAGARWLENQRLALAGAVEALQSRNAVLERSNARLMALAHTDMLTGLCNRYRFEEMLEAEIGRVRRNRSALCAVMVDLDLFKLVNDHLGHDIGDVALSGAARALRTSSRPYDVVARYGGEEFVLLLPDTGLRAGAECAERLRRAVETESAGSAAPVTASLGVAELAPDEDKKSLLRRADAALYLAKQRGRNRVECDQTVDTA